MPDSEPSVEAFSTLTHARLRILQGDYRSAARMLRERLDRCPQDAAARALLSSIRDHETIESPHEPVAALPPPTAGDPRRLSREFGAVLGGDPARRKIRRLERWLERLQRER